MKFNLKILFLLLLFFNGLFVYTQSFQSISQKQFFFVENRGQVIDLENKVDTTVRYIFKSNQANVYLKNNGFSYLLRTSNKIGKELNSFNTLDSIHQLDLEFLNIESECNVNGKKKSQAYFNYYYPHCPKGILGVRAFEEIYCENLYDGIDVRYYNYRNSLEYDYIVKKSANPESIQFQWNGADQIEIGVDGILRLSTHLGTIYEQLPEVYQIINGVKFPVNAKYKFIDESKGILGFDLGSYNLCYDLVIDPWMTYFGGSETDIGLTVDLDDSNHLYVGGITGSKSLISKAGFRDSFMGGFNDGFISKFTTSGQLIWSTYYGGNGADNVVTIKCDPNGDLFVSGLTMSDTGISHKGYQMGFGGQADGFIMKMNKKGERIWSTYVGGADNDACSKMILDDSCNIFVCGGTSSDTGIAYYGMNSTYQGFGDGFVAKYDSTGRKLWASYYGGTRTDQFSSLFLDKNKNLYLTGQTSSSNGIATTGAFQTSYAQNRDGYLIKMNTNGALIWGTYYGGKMDDYLLDLVCDTFGDIYACGASTSSSSVAMGGYQTTYKASRDALVIKFNSSGNHIWSTYLGGANQDYAQYMDIDPNTNHVFVTGDTYSKDFPVTPCASQDSLKGIENNFITRFFPDGRIFCSSYYGDNHEEDSKIVVKDCKIYMTGWSYGNGLIPFNNPHQDSFKGKADAYISELNSYTCGYKPIEVSYDVKVKNNEACDNNCTGEAELIINECTPNLLYRCEWSTSKKGVYTTDSIIYINQLCAGQYWINVSIDCGPSDTIYFSIKDSSNGVLPVFLGNDTFVCFRDSILLKSNINGDKYEWQNSSNVDSFWAKDSGWYSLKVSSGNCEGIDSVYIEIPLLPFSLGKDSSICENDSILLKGEKGKGQYLWSNNSNDSFIYVKDSGLYWLEVSNKTCKIRDSLEIKVLRVPRFELGNDTVICKGDSIQLKFPNTNIDFTWDNGSDNPLRTVREKGVYYAKTIHLCGEYSDSINVSEFEIILDAFVNSDTQCLDNQQFQFSSTGNGSNIVWDFGDGNQATGRNVTHQYSQSGLFQIVTLSSIQLGCEMQDTLNVWVIESSISDFDFEVKSCSNILELNNLSNPNLLFYWNIDSVIYVGRKVNYEMNFKGDYKITLFTEDSSGKCKDTLSRMYTFDQATGGELKVPNVFTPNEDNFNDCFELGEGGDDCWGDYKVYIYNRWGIQVFSGDYPKTCWNGRLNNTGEELPEGTYYYLIDGMDDTSQSFSGVIYLMR